jgi:hypothetical protein
MAIEAKIISAPTNCELLKELGEVDDQITKGDIKLNDEVQMKLTNDEKMAHSYAWHTHQETTESLKKSRGKVYSLLLGQCTQVLFDKMKQDADWVTIVSHLTQFYSSSLSRNLYCNNPTINTRKLC